jgi:putative ubiquitin-RnfH superfamily antitoxin RatB of RatAB toxin-antitoxin module
MDPAERGSLYVEVVYCAGPGEVDQVELVLRADATVHDALLASGLQVRHPGIELTRRRVGVWGQLRELDAPLRDGDRVEVYRPLLIDPMQARRARHARQRGK